MDTHQVSLTQRLASARKIVATLFIGSAASMASMAYGQVKSEFDKGPRKFTMPTGITTWEGWPALVIEAKRISPANWQPLGNEFTGYLVISCKSPGIVPKVEVWSDAISYLKTGSAEMQINDEAWLKVLPTSAGDRTGKTVFPLMGGLILVDRVAKTNGMKFKAKTAFIENPSEFFIEFRTQFQTLQDTAYVDFLKKKCGVLGLK
jgi:hypothetical protein